MVVIPKEIGDVNKGTSKSVAERKITGRAVVPGSTEVREVELFDATPAVNSREVITTPDDSGLEFLTFARVLLDTDSPGYGAIEIALQDGEEALLYVSRGSAEVEAAGQSYALSRGDVLYLGLGEDATISTDGFADISEYRARRCSTKFPVQHVRHSDIEKTELAAQLGGVRPMTKRTVFKLVDTNVDTCRLLFGDTYMAQPGAVGSYPPHFHGPEGEAGLGDDAKEEIYHFRCASQVPGEPAYVLQNCSRPGEPIGTYVHVFDDQAINVTPSYHDTIAPPPVEFMFTWCLASFTEGKRDWSRVLNRPGYENEK